MGNITVIENQMKDENLSNIIEIQDPSKDSSQADIEKYTEELYLEKVKLDCKPKNAKIIDEGAFKVTSRNLKYLLGHAVKEENFKEALGKLFERDYKNKG